MTSIKSNKIQSYCCFPSILNIPDDHFYSINREKKQVIFNLLSSSQRMYSFSNIFLKGSSEDFINQELTSLIIEDLSQGYNTSIISIADNNPHDIMKDIFNLVHNSLLEQRNFGLSALSDIACGSFVIIDDLCFDLLSGLYVDIKELEESKDILIEGLSYQKVKEVSEGDLFISNIIENYFMKDPSGTNALCFRILCTFNTSDNEMEHSNNYLSKLDIITIQFNKSSLIKSKEINTVMKSKEDQFSCLIKAINYPNGRHAFDLPKGFSLLLKEYIGGNTKTSIIASINEIMQLSKEESNITFSFLSNAMSIKNHPIPKQDTQSNLLFYKSLYHQLVNKKDCISGDLNQDLISQIKELLFKQYSFGTTLKRFPFISLDILNSVNKYKEECEAYYVSSYNEISTFKQSLEQALNEINNFNQIILNQKESNGKADLDVIKTIEQFSDRILQIIDLLKNPLPSHIDNEENYNQNKVERDAFLSLLNFYSFKEVNDFCYEDGEKLKELIYNIIELNESLYNHLTKGKVINSYEIIDKQEYNNLIRQLNESKYNGQRKEEETMQESRSHYKTVSMLEKEIEELNKKISMLQSKSNKQPFGYLLINKQKDARFEYKGKTNEYRDNIKQKRYMSPQTKLHYPYNQRKLTSSSFSILSKQSPHKKSKSQIKVKTKSINNTGTTCTWYSKDTNGNNIIITKEDNFTYFKTISRNRKSSSKQKTNSYQKMKLTKQNNSMEFIMIPKESREFLKKQIEEKINEIKHLKLFNEYSMKQKDSEISSLCTQLTNSKNKIVFLEEEAKEVHLAKDLLLKENTAFKAEKIQQRALTLSPNRQFGNMITQTYSAKRNPRPLSIVNNPNNSPQPQKPNASLEINTIIEQTPNNNSRIRREFRKNERCENNSHSQKTEEGYKTSRIFVNKITGQGLNDSAMRLLDEIREDNDMLLSELIILKSKNKEIANDLKKLSKVNIKSNKKKYNSSYTEFTKKDLSKEKGKD